MAQIHLDRTSPRTRMTVVILAVLAGAIGGAAIWQQTQTPATTADHAVVPEALPPAAAAATARESILIAEVQAQQAAAAQEILQHPEVKPIVGNVSDKPPFVSQMEWNMLKGVAQQHANPEKELTRLVNFVRFTKQLELWQALPEQTDAATRQTLANELLEDLPQRLKQEELDLAAVQKLQAELLNDAVQDPQERQVRAAQEARRLIQPQKETSAPQT